MDDDFYASAIETLEILVNALGLSEGQMLDYEASILDDTEACNENTN